MFKINKLTEVMVQDDLDFEDGDEVVGVFSDGVLILAREGKDIQMKIILGVPYIFDESITDNSIEESMMETIKVLNGNEEELC